MSRIPSIKSVMTPFPHFADWDQPATEALEMMTASNIHHLPVKRDGRLFSVISARDIHLAGRDGFGALRVADVCSPDAYIVDLAEPLDRVLAHMSTHHVHCALVVKEERLAGIFTVSDACRSFQEFLRSHYGDGGHEAA